ncbi:MAG: hypothetical protein EZS28_012349 [Streblomastix strix]|uniref:Uncharacterized protein n=1 Tax=Streblomastix strix TaxID=222440 RepID=A0A5J4WCM2_9EUKA|nr:MAG: hypothetical protein EZS28_012349 [Streblomastix strix]
MKGDSSFVIWLSLLIETSMRIIGMILSFVGQNSETRTILTFYVPIAAAVPLTQMFQLNVMNQIIFAGNFAMSISVSISLLLVSFQQLIGHFSYRNVLKLPKIVFIANIITSIIQLGVWVYTSIIYSKLDKKPTHDENIRKKESSIRPSEIVFTVPPKIFTSIVKSS